jgi:hypothetical protein
LAAFSFNVSAISSKIPPDLKSTAKLLKFGVSFSWEVLGNTRLQGLVVEVRKRIFERLNREDTHAEEPRRKEETL